MCVVAVRGLPSCIMNELSEPQSGYVVEIDPEAVIDNRITDIEVLRITESNVIAKGRRFGRWWLIKGIRSDVLGSTSLKVRLIKEFELQSRMQHPGIARVISIEEVGDMGPCIIMEWIEGETLSEAMKRNACIATDRKRIMHEVIEAVVHIHSQGVVHRDLKPSNIMVRRSGGKAVIIDFGLADSDDYTELKYPAGTTGFISPEQVKEGGVHPSDDIYSLGVIMNILCPEYSRLARQCKLPVPQRISDASDLLKRFERRQHRWKTALVTGAITSTVALLLAATFAVLSFHRADQQAKETIMELNEQNNQNISLITTLTDSLEMVNRKFSESEQLRQNTENYLSAKNEAMKNGYAAIDEVLIRFDRDSLSMLGPDDKEIFNRRLTSLLRTLEKTTENYNKSLHTSTLKPDDIEFIRRDLYNYTAVAVSDYQKKWMKNIFPDAN